DNLRQAISRWRKRQIPKSQRTLTAPFSQGATSSAVLGERRDETRPQAEISEAPHTRSTNTPTFPRPVNSREPLTKARLREIREQHIDLDAINREARIRRRGD